MNTFPGVILAGGKSTRMGKEKAFLEVGGKQLIRRVADVMMAVCSDVSVVGGTEEKFSHHGLPWFPDKVPGLGPLGGIETALLRKKSDIVVAACDLPYLTPDLLRFLLQHHDPHAHPITVVRRGSTVQPLLGVYGIRCLEHLSLFLRTGKRRVMDFLNECPTTFLSLDSASSPLPGNVLLNLNTPAEYLSALDDDAS